MMQDDGTGVVQLHGLTVRAENGKLQRARPSGFSLYQYIYYIGHW